MVILEDMNTTQRIKEVAKSRGFTVTQEGREMVARDAERDAIFSATIEDGRFRGGYVVDRMGHVVSHSTVRDFLRHAAAA